MSFRYLKFWIKTAFLFLSRSARSTAVLSLMVVIAVSLLIFLSALAIGINDAMIRNSVGLYSGHISGDILPQSLTPESLKIDGVAGVLKRSLIPGILSNGDYVETITMVAVKAAAELKYTAIWKKSIEGKYIQDGENTIFLSSALAKQLGVKTGGILQFTPAMSKKPVRLMVSGIYRTEIDYLDRGIAFCPIEILQVKTPMWRAAIFLNKGIDPGQIIRRYRLLLPESLEFRSWQEMMPDLVQLIDLNYVSMGIVMVLVFGVVSLGIACAFVIFIFKNLREYGIMKAMGVTPREIACLLVIEVIMMNLIASSVGILGGFLSVLIAGRTGIDLTYFTSHNRYFVVSGIIFPRPTFYSLCLPPILAFFFSMVAAIWPAWLVARKKAADILRSI
jgi:ABC-type lipoprotein release transport system permease subunit